MASESKRNRLPFEPKSKKKPKSTPAQEVKASTPKNAPSPEADKLAAIPKTVSKRMVRRMALFSGIPTAMGIGSFFAFYWVVSQAWFEVPTSAVLLVSMGLFGLGVLGLSYGILSASWDEHRLGGLWGWDEFTVNFSRMTSAWRSEKKVKKDS